MPRPATPRAKTPAASNINSLAGTAMPSPGDEHAFYIVDLSGYVFRAYHAIAPLSNSKGEPTHAVYGTTQMLKRLVEDRRPAHLAVAMDSRGGGFRKEIDPRYKANRVAPPPDLSQQMARCEEIVRAYRIPIFQRDGLEADDLIASLAKRALLEPQMRVVVVSSDKDLMQLVEERLVLWDTMRDRVYGVPEVAEKFSVTPTQLRDLLALMGDTSDNVPGVPGVGPKTAADLIAQFDTIDALYEALRDNRDGLRPKLRQSLLENEGEARISQKLVTLRSDEEVVFDLSALRYDAPGEEATSDLRKLFMELEFGRLVESLKVTHAIQRTYRTLSTRQELEAFAAEARAAIAQDAGARLAIEVETSSPRPVDAALIGIGMACKAGEGVYVPIGHRYLGVPAQPSIADVRAILGPLFADPAVPKVAHDVKLLSEALRVAGMPLAGAAFDTLLAHYLLDPEAPHGLRELAHGELATALSSYDQVTRKDAVKRGRQLAFDEVAIEEATTYVGAHADVARELAERFGPRLEGAGLGPLMRDVELPLTAVLAEMELAGIAIDVARMRQLSAEVEVQLRGIEEQARQILRAAAGADEHLVRDFNLGSPKQLETILFDVLKLPVLKRTKTSRSTDADVLEELAEKHPLPAVVLEHRSLSKLKGTYLDALPKLVSPKTNRIHTNYQQHVAATGRLSSTDPNLQNIPIRTELGKKIRAAFVAPEGFVLMSADYSQIELRILADLSKDPLMCDAFVRGEDIHTRTSLELFGEATKDNRHRAKAVNFGVVYGQGENALAKSLGISREEAAGFIARYFERYAGVRGYMDEQIEIARRGEGVRTLLGRRRFLADIHSPNRALRAQAERIARNTPIQGTAADVLKLAMVALVAPPVDGARMLLTVHDELVFEVPESRVEEAAKVVREKMEGVVKLAVPLVVDVGWGKDWAQAK